MCQIWGCFFLFSYCPLHLNSAFKTTTCGEGKQCQAGKLGLCCHHHPLSSEAAKEVAVVSPRKTSHGRVKDLKYLVRG